MSYIPELERINNILTNQLYTIEKMSKIIHPPYLNAMVSTFRTMDEYTSRFNKSTLTSPFTSVNMAKECLSGITLPINNFGTVLSSLKMSSTMLPHLNASEMLISTAKQIESACALFKNNNFCGMVEFISKTQKVLDLYTPEINRIQDNISSILNNIEVLNLKNIDTSFLSSIEMYTASSESLINSTDKLTSVLKEKSLSRKLADDPITASACEIDTLTQNQSNDQSINITLKKIYKAALDLMTIYSFILSVFFDKTGLILENQNLIINTVVKIDDRQDRLENDVSELKDMIISLEEDNQKLSEQIGELTRSNQELTVIVSQLSDDIQNQP